MKIYSLIPATILLALLLLTLSVSIVQFTLKTNDLHPAIARQYGNVLTKPCRQAAVDATCEKQHEDLFTSKKSLYLQQADLSGNYFDFCHAGWLFLFRLNECI